MRQGGSWQSACGPVFPDSSGNFSCDWNTASGLYPDGTYSVAINAYDNAGNLGQTSDTMTVSNNVAPALTRAGPGSNNAAWIGGTGLQTVNASASEAMQGSSPPGMGTLVLSAGGWSQTLEADCGEGEDNCPLDGSFDLAGTSLPDGPQTVTLTGTDVAGAQAAQTWSVNVDNTPPTVTDSGSLRSAEGQATLLPAYNLHVAAHDRGSGMAGIQVLVDGKEVAATGQGGCTGADCSLDYTYLPVNCSLTAAHVISVKASDAVGNVGSDMWVVNPQPQAQITGSGCRASAQAQQPPTGAVSDTAAAALTLLRQTAPPVVADTTQATINGRSVNPVIAFGPTGYSSSQGITSFWFSDTAGKGLAVGDQADPVCITPATVDTQVTTGTAAGNAGEIFANFEPDTDLLQRATAYGGEELLQVRDNLAPQQFAWNVNVASDESLVPVGSNTVAVVRAFPASAPGSATSGPPDDGSAQPPSDSQAASGDGDTAFGTPTSAAFSGTADVLPAPGTVAPGSTAFAIADVPDANKQSTVGNADLNGAAERVQGTVRAIIRAPAAIDANGRQVAVSLGVQSSQIVLTVPHDANTAYPLVVDPQTESNPTAGESRENTITGPDYYCQGGAGPVQLQGSTVVKASGNGVCDSNTVASLSRFRVCIQQNVYNKDPSDAHVYQDWGCSPNSVQGQPTVYPPDVSHVVSPHTLCDAGTVPYLTRMTFTIATKPNFGDPNSEIRRYAIQGKSPRTVTCEESALWKFTANAEFGRASTILRNNLSAQASFQDVRPIDPQTRKPFGFAAHHIVPANDGRTSAAQDARARGWRCQVGFAPGLLPFLMDNIYNGGRVVGQPDPNSTVNGVLTRGPTIGRKGDGGRNVRATNTDAYNRLVKYDTQHHTAFASRAYDPTLHTTAYYRNVYQTLTQASMDGTNDNCLSTGLNPLRSRIRANGQSH